MRSLASACCASRLEEEGAALKIQSTPLKRAHDLSMALRFSLLFRRSTRFLCIFSPIFWNRSRSSFAARFVRMASIRRYCVVSWTALAQLSPSLHTCRSASFSSLSSFSFALTAASALRSSVRFSHDVRFPRGRKGPLLSCHCLPGHGVSLRCFAVLRVGAAYRSSSFP